MVQERRGMLKTWNLTLMISTFVLVLFGTFLTRSGIIDSVHAFSEGTIGPLFFSFIAFVLIVSLGLIGWRANRLHAAGQIEGAVSRESAFVLNNVLFVGFTFTVLLGTMFPIIIEAVRGDRISVGAPYFDMVASPIGVALLVLMGVGPALPWRRASGEKIRKAFRVGVSLAVLSAAVAFASGIREVYPILTIAAAAFVMTTIVEEFAKGVSARRRISGRSFGGALVDLFVRNGQRYGGYVVHTGVVVVALAISVSWTWRSEREETLRVGERMSIGDYEVEFVELWAVEEAQRFVIGSTLNAYRNGRPIGEERPRMNIYPASPQPIATPAVNTSLTSDLYLTLMAFDQEEGQHATIRAIVNPGIAWLWIGGLIMGLGSLIDNWPRGTGRAKTDGDALLAETAAAVAFREADVAAASAPKATAQTAER
jgi:cytochrome c-type biogenesis protein CcmF